MASVSRQMSGKPTNRPSGITSGFPVIRPESMPSADITSYKPTSRYLSACPDLDCFQLADKPEIVSLLDF
jgi:hypothetical protein